MKNVVILEDEVIAARNLERQLAAVNPDLQVLTVLQSIEDSVDYFRTQPAPDLVFMDIHLADGSAFAIFEQVEISCPIIFTTAYDQYALEAFKVNSVDYLLKPFDIQALRHALEKLERLTAGNATADSQQLQHLVGLLQQQCRQYKRYFLIPAGERLIPFPVDQIAFVHLGEKISYIYDHEGHRLAYDKPLDAIVAELNPRNFFRANRQFIVAHRAVKELSVWPIGKLKLLLTPPAPEPVIVSRARVAEFKNWYTK